MRKLLTILVILILSSITVLATGVEPKANGVLSLVPLCNEEGRLIFTISSYDVPTDYYIDTNEIDLWLINDKDSAISLNDKGTWSREKIKAATDYNQRTSIFTTEIDTIHNEGTYKIRINYKAEASNLIDERSRQEVDYEQEKIFYCGGYIFSCSILEMSIDTCETDDNTLRIEHTVKGLTQSPAATIDLATVQYQIQAEKPYTDAEGKTSTFAGLPVGSKTSIKGDKFILEAPFEDNNIEAVTIKYDISKNKYTKTCIEGTYISASSTCNKPAEPTQETAQEPTQEQPRPEGETPAGEGLEGITGAAVSDSKTYSTKTKLLIAAIVVLLVIIIGYYATREKEPLPEEPKEEKKEEKK